MTTTRWIIIALVIVIIAVLGAWLFLDKEQSSEIVNFSRSGNLIMNNPGFTPDVWYISYEEPGSPGLSKQLIFDNQSQCGTSTNLGSCNLTFNQGQRVQIDGVLENDMVRVKKLITNEQVSEGRNIKLYYYNPALDQGLGGAQCSRDGLVAVERTIPITNTPIQDAIKLLLRGEISAEEKALGATTEFPLSGVALDSASLVNGVLTLAFNDPQNKTSGGSCRVGILWFQIEATAKQFPEVTSVRFLPEELFQP